MIILNHKSAICHLQKINNFTTLSHNGQNNLNLDYSTFKHQSFVCANKLLNMSQNNGSKLQYLDKYGTNNQT